MLKILQAGLYTSIQDNGRFGYRKYGVPQSGVMDQYSSNLANALLNNNVEDAVLEITWTGPLIQFDQPTQIAICGAIFDMLLNNTPIYNNKVYTIQKGDILQFGALKKGARSYLAVHGGFTSPIFKESRSYYSPISPQNRILKGDTISYQKYNDPRIEFNSKINTPQLLPPVTPLLPFYKGVEWEILSPKQKEKIAHQTFTISSENNRMGYRMKESIGLVDSQILTSPVIPGTAQITPTGNIIILMKDAQTTGGYPRILQLTNDSICHLAQMKTNDQFKLRLTHRKH